MILCRYPHFLKQDTLWTRWTELVLRSRKLETLFGVGDHDTCNCEREPSNVGDIDAWDSANKHLLSVSRPTTISAARSVLLQFEPRNGRPGGGEKLG